MAQSSVKSISSPISIVWYPTLAVFMLAIGLIITASFFIYEATSSRRNRSLAKELTTGAVASVFLGFGSLFLLLASGVYAVPIPSSRASAVPNIFNLAAEKLGFKFTNLKSNNDSDARKQLRKQFDGKRSVFYVELADGTILSHAVEENEKFPVQFGREVMAGLLNMADRADWKNCKLSKEEEIKMVETFKNRFEEYDPNR